MSFRSLVFVALLALGSPAGAACASVPGINNFGEVDKKVYRGAQPTDEGIKYLAKLGIKVVVDLRGNGERSRSEERMVTAAGMRYVNIPLSGLMPPSAADTTLILGLLKDPATGPVFVHCKRGADRTGGVIAAYRIDHDKWGNRRALKEAKANGMSRLQIPRQNYIRSFRRGSAREASGAASSSGAPADKETGSDASK